MKTILAALIVAAIGAGMCTAGTTSGPSNNAPANYDYKYHVFDDAYPPPGSSDYGKSSGGSIPVDFSAHESRQGDSIKGTYEVLLPDGQRQIVTYYVDGYSGYVANVKHTTEINPTSYTSSIKAPHHVKQQLYAPISTPYYVIDVPATKASYTSTPYVTTTSTPSTSIPEPYSISTYSTTTYTSYDPYIRRRGQHT